MTVNKTAHGLVSGDYFLFESVTLPGGGATSFTTANFTDQTFEVITAAADTFTITMASNETGTGMTAAGSATIRAYVEIGPTIQTYGYGWGTGTWGGSMYLVHKHHTLNGALLNDANGTGGSGTNITFQVQQVFLQQVVQF